MKATMRKGSSKGGYKMSGGLKKSATTKYAGAMKKGSKKSY